MGERFSALTSPAAYRSASALLSLAPYTPLLFMGQEWAASMPFFYFIDHEPDLGAKITDGRGREFPGFPEFVDEAARKRIPDPQNRETFVESKLRWAEAQEPAHAAIWNLYVECLHLRKEFSALRPVERSVWSAKEISWGAGAVRYEQHGSEILILFDLTGHHGGIIDIDEHWRERLSTGDSRFGGGGEVVVDLASSRVDFHTPGLIVLTR
jgi:maltooligosyltrehalose trehalohydrolase